MAAERTITMAQEHEFPSYVAYGTLLRGWGLTESGELQAGLLQMRQGLADARADKSENSVPGFLAYLADAYRKVGQIEDGLILIAEAQALVEKSQERWQEAEIYRIKGELTLHKSRVGIAHHDVMVVEAGTVGGAHPTADEEAERCFHKAIEVARQQQAKSLVVDHRDFDRLKADRIKRHAPIRWQAAALAPQWQGKGVGA